MHCVVTIKHHLKTKLFTETILWSSDVKYYVERIYVIFL